MPTPLTQREFGENYEIKITRLQICPGDYAQYAAVGGKMDPHGQTVQSFVPDGCRYC